MRTPSDEVNQAYRRHLCIPTGVRQTFSSIRDTVHLHSCEAVHLHPCEALLIVPAPVLAAPWRGFCYQDFPLEPLFLDKSSKGV